MDIKVKPSKMFYGGEYHKLFYLRVSSGNATIEEDIDEKDVVSLVMGLLDETILSNHYHNQIVERLVEVGILTERQILEYAQDACSKDEGLFMIKSALPKSTALCKNGSKFELKGGF